MDSKEYLYQPPQPETKAEATLAEEIWRRKLTQWPWVVASLIALLALVHLEEALSSLWRRFIKPPSASIANISDWRIIVLGLLGFLPLISSLLLGFVSRSIFMRGVNSIIWVRVLRCWACLAILCLIPAHRLLYVTILEDRLSPESIGAAAPGKVSEVTHELMMGEIQLYLLDTAKWVLLLCWFARRRIREEVANWGGPLRYSQYPSIPRGVPQTNCPLPMKRSDEDVF